MVQFISVHSKHFEIVTAKGNQISRIDRRWKGNLRSKLFPALEEVFRSHLCWLEKLIEHHREFHGNILKSSTISVHTHTYKHSKAIEHTQKGWNIIVTSFNQPKLNVEDRGFHEIGHTLHVEDLLNLSSTLYNGVHCLSVNNQLWKQWLRTLNNCIGKSVWEHGDVFANIYEYIWV